LKCHSAPIKKIRNGTREQFHKEEGEMKNMRLTKTGVALMLAIMFGAGSASARPWKFGVMGDTQWTTIDPANANPHTVPLSIITQINQQFIDAGVDFVIEVGDLTDDGNDISEVTRAKAAQPLIDAGIGFFPFRGNHETYGTNNDYGIPIFRSNYPQTQTGIFTTSDGDQYKLGTSFSSPTTVSADLTGMSYSFDYGRRDDSARFVIIDPWATPSKVDNNADGYAYGYTVNDQQAWISDRLDKSTRRTMHAFVFSHQPLMAESHQDTMFSGYTNANLDWQNAFYASLQSNGVKYFIGGHDHMYQRCMVSSPDGLSQVEEIISASNSSKFYTPKPLDDPRWFGQKVRETSISQELYTVGYYIYTVDGTCVTVDYYSDDHGNWQSDANYPNGPGRPDTGITPAFNFVKKEIWGYCQNGKEFLVPQGNSYTVVQDSFEGTTAQILDGINTSTARDSSLNTKGGTGRPLTKTVDTGWISAGRCMEKHLDLRSDPDPDLASNIFKLWGMADLGGFHGDTYVLSLSYDRDRLYPADIKAGPAGLVTRSKDGRWVNAVDENIGGTTEFILGPYRSGDELGTYGIDPKTRTAWAVINHTGDFAVAGFRHQQDR
jgi:hypothetical protein